MHLRCHQIYQYSSSLIILVLFQMGCVRESNDRSGDLGINSANTAVDVIEPNSQHILTRNPLPTIENLQGVWRYPTAGDELHHHEELGPFEIFYSFRPPGHFEVNATYYETFVDNPFYEGIVDNEDPDAVREVTYKSSRSGEIEVKDGSFEFDGATYTIAFEDDSTLWLSIFLNGETESERYRCFKTKPVAPRSASTE